MAIQGPEKNGGNKKRSISLARITVMLKIGIDVRPMINTPAGIGHYVKGLVTTLPKLDKENLYFLYAGENFNLHGNVKNFKKVIVTKKGVPWHFAVYRDLKSKKIDIYHSTHSFVLPIFPFLKTVVTYHDASSVLFPERHSLKVKTLGKILFSFSAKRAQHIIVPSLSTKRDVIGITKIQEDKISVIPEGVNKFGITWKKDEKDPYIFFVGTLEPRKNIESILRAYRILKDKYSIKEKLVIAGGAGWLSSHLKTLARNLDISQYINFAGYVSQKEKAILFKKASVFVFPSLYEGFGLPVLEAMGVGVPVVTSNISSLPEITGNAALLVPPNDAEKVAQAIWSILRNEAVALDLSKKGLHQAEKYSWEKCARNTLKVYMKVAAMS